MEYKHDISIDKQYTIAGFIRFYCKTKIEKVINYIYISNIIGYFIPNNIICYKIHQQTTNINIRKNNQGSIIEVFVDVKFLKRYRQENGELSNQTKILICNYPCTRMGIISFPQPQILDMSTIKDYPYIYYECGLLRIDSNNINCKQSEIIGFEAYKNIKEFKKWLNDYHLLNYKMHGVSMKNDGVLASFDTANEKNKSDNIEEYGILPKKDTHEPITINFKLKKDVLHIEKDEDSKHRIVLQRNFNDLKSEFYWYLLITHHPNQKYEIINRFRWFFILDQEPIDIDDLSNDKNENFFIKYAKYGEHHSMYTK